MKDNKQYYLYRIRLEKLKQKTWVLVLLARLLGFFLFLVSFVHSLVTVDALNVFQPKKPNPIADRAWPAVCEN